MKVNQKTMDERYMHIALDLAKRGIGQVSPNPLVGCVIVKDNRIVGYGYHERFGEAHAEINALHMAGRFARNSTVYVTLEPCSHYGKTPPCAPRLVEAGIRRCVIGMRDPNPKVDGAGIVILRKAGIEVITGVLEDDCKWINRGFLTKIRHSRPWVSLKAAISLDGDVALSNGESKWITSPQARQVAHLLRSEHDAILIGSRTALMDDPCLTVRHTSGKSPLRILLDRDLCTSPESSIIGDGRCLIVSSISEEDKLIPYSCKGCTFLELPMDEHNHFDIAELLHALAERDITTLLVEGGASVLSSFIEAEMVDWLSLFVSPKLMGHGTGVTEYFRINSMKDAVLLSKMRTSRVGNDYLVEGRMQCSPVL